LHRMSHGEAFLSVMQNRFDNGLFILDEPETALSPTRQLTLLALMYELSRAGNSQFLVATHSPILLTYPQARIVSFDEASLPSVAFTDTQHYQITSGILRQPESYWKHLRESK
jgi:predicted ATPase